MTTTDAAAEAATQIPGLVVRPYAGEADHPEIVRIQNAEYEADDVRGRLSVPELDAWLRHPSEQFDPARDLRVAELDGTPGGLRVDRLGRHDRWAARVPHPRLRGSRRAAPGHRDARSSPTACVGSAIGRRRTRRTGRRCSGTCTHDQAVGGRALARTFGLEPVRWFFDMERSLTRRAAASPAAAGRHRGAAGRSRGRAGDLARRPRRVPGSLGRVRPVGGGAIGAGSTRPSSTRRCSSSPTTARRSREPSLNVIYPEENKELGIKRGWLDERVHAASVAAAGPGEGADRPVVPSPARAGHGDRRARRRCREPVRRARPVRGGRLRGDRADDRLAAATGGEA